MQVDEGPFGAEPWHSYEAEGNLMCVCLQHEIDHLHGVTMIDHLSLEDRAAALEAYREALASGAKPGDVDAGDGE